MSNWKIIAQKVPGTSHIKSSKPCEDAFQHRVVTDAAGEEILLGCLSDGAGSAMFGGFASQYVVEGGLKLLLDVLNANGSVNENDIFCVAEKMHEELENIARKNSTDLREYSCTFLGFVLQGDEGVYFQIGDGAIVIGIDGSHALTPVFWPQNGEYQNTTHFLIEDANLSNLMVKTLSAKVNKIAAFTDGLQSLALVNNDTSVHQPFFKNMFLYLERCHGGNSLGELETKLEVFLNSPQVNERTDDDKTLLLAINNKQ